MGWQDAPVVDDTTQPAWMKAPKVDDPTASPEPAVLTGADAIPGSGADQRRRGVPGAPPRPVQPAPAPPSFADNVAGAVQSAMALADNVVYGGLGMAAGFVRNIAEGTATVTTAADRVKRGVPAVLPGEQLPKLDPMMGEGAQQAIAQANAKGGDRGQVPMNQVGQDLTDKYIDPAMQNMIPIMGLHGEMSRMSAAAPAAKAAVSEGLRSAAREAPSATRAVASDIVNAGGTAADQLAGRAAAQRPTVAAQEQAKAASLEGPTLQGIRDANAAGYVLTPSETKQGGVIGAVGETTEGLAGEPKLAKAASKKNAEVTNALVRQDVGLPDDTPVSRASLAQLRADAGEKYNVLKQVGEITNDDTYFSDLDNITKAYDTAAESFPHRSDNPFQKTVDGLRQEKVSGAAAVEEVKLLRADADKQFSTGDKGLGRAYRDAANALDNSIDRHLSRMVDEGADPALAGAVDEYRAARRTIAKTYLADSALNDTTGNIDAGVYARALKKGAPLSGPGLTVARAAQQFPRMLQKTEKLGNTGGPTIMDAGLSLLGGAKGALLGARPAARSVLLLKPVQKMLTQRARGARPVIEPPVPPAEPTTSPGAAPDGGNGGGGGTPPAGPLGDLTPDWSTTPGAGSPPVEGIDATGLHRAVGEPPTTTGNRKAPLEIPAVPGRPDLPDTIVSGGPAETAATARANAAMNEPGAIEARARQQNVALRAENDALRQRLGIPVGEVREGQPPIAVEKPGRIPVGKATEGQPEIKTKTPDSLPAGEATEIKPERVEPAPEPIPTAEAYEMTPEQEAQWRGEFKLGDDDAQRAKDVAQAMRHDEPAVQRAAVQHERSPRAFDREIERINEEGKARETKTERTDQSREGNAAESGTTEREPAGAAGAAVEQPGADRTRSTGAERTEPAATAGQAPGGVEIREVPGGFEAHKDGKKVGYLKDNLERGQAKQLGESANVDMVKVDKDQQGTGVGRALYAAFNDKHEGRIMPSGKTEPQAWALWKRNYPEKVDAFVKQEAARIRDGADQRMVVGNIKDPEIAQRVTQEAASGANPKPDNKPGAVQPKGREKGVPEDPEEVFKAGEAQTLKKPVGSPEALDGALRAKFGDKLIEGLKSQGILKYALALDEGKTGPQRFVKAVMRERSDGQSAATLYYDRLHADEAPAALMHELGEHFGIVRLLGHKRYRVMLDDLRSLRRTEPEIKEAWDTVKRRYVGDDKLGLTEGDTTFLREVAANLVENHPDLPFVRRLINEVRAFFYENFGTTMGNRVDANLVRGLAASALRKAAAGDLPKMHEPVRMVPRRPSPGGDLRPIQ